jgi:hypothetical protein
MFEDDPPEAARLASAVSILHCLEALLEEADRLGMPRTVMAMRKTVRACQAEQVRPPAYARPRRNLVMH